MNIGFDAKRAHTNRTGLGNYSRWLLHALAETAPEMALFGFTPELGDRFPTPPPSYRPVLPSGTLAKQPALWRFLGDEAQAKKLQLNIFHGLSNELPRNALATKQVVTIHDLLYKRWPGNFNAIDRVLYDAKTRFACRTAQRIIAVSEQTKSDLMTLLNVPSEKIEVVYQNCAASFYEDVPQAQIHEVKTKYGLVRPYILSVGTLEPRKNQYRLSQAFLASSLFETHDLVLVGSSRFHVGKHIAELLRQPFAGTIKHLSHVSAHELPALYQGAAASAYVSLAEGFGIPILESLACGTPVVATQGGCFAEAGGRLPIYVEPESLLSISDGLWKATVGRLNPLAAKNHMAQFATPLLAHKLIALYQGLI